MQPANTTNSAPTGFVKIDINNFIISSNDLPVGASVGVKQAVVNNLNV